MYILLVSGAIFFAILLVLVVLAQNSKGGGLSNQFGGSGASNLIGVKKTGDILERLTWGFATDLRVAAGTVRLVLVSAASLDRDEGGA